MQPVTVELKNHRGEVLVAIMNNHADFVIARDQHWYRIPISSVNKLLKHRWPPRWLAFYQTKIFGPEAYAIQYYAPIVNIRQMSRWQLFPHLPRDRKSNQRYYQLLIEPLQCLPKPILSRRLRRVLFIPTTWQKFIQAIEINDLYGDSPQEDRLWAELQRLQIQAERQELVKINWQDYALDFAIYCPKGKINVETDDDIWQPDSKQAAQNNRRDSALEVAGWHVLRFNAAQVQEEMAEYCVPTITDTINKLGGVAEEKTLSYQKLI